MSSYRSAFDSFSAWAGPTGFFVCVIGIPAILILWLFLRVRVKRRLRAQAAIKEAESAAQSARTKGFSPFDRPDDLFRKVDQPASSSFPSSPEVTVTHYSASYTIDGQPVREFTQQTANALGPILLDAGPNPAQVMRVMQDLGRMSLLMAKACLDSAPCPLPTTLIGPLGMDAAQADAFIAALRNAGARMLVPAPDSIAWRFTHST